jgi:hypothetical protein
LNGFWKNSAALNTGCCCHLYFLWWQRNIIHCKCFLVSSFHRAETLYNQFQSSLFPCPFGFFQRMFFFKANIFVLLTFEYPSARATHRLNSDHSPLHSSQLAYCFAWLFLKLFKQSACSQTSASLYKLFQKNKPIKAFPWIWSENPLTPFLWGWIKLKNPLGHHLIQFS